MSHLSQIATEITNKELLIQACKNVGHPILEVRENYFVRYYAGQKAHADVVCILEGDYDIGFLRINGKFNGVADFSLGNCGGSSESLKALWNQITKEYARLEGLNWANSNKNKLGTNAHVTLRVH